ncbi:MAG: alpha/beta fold hydrolase [Rhodoglobus sp.]
MTVDSPYAALLSDTPVRKASVDVLGSRTHYWEYGPSESVITLVLVHGYRGEHHGLEPVVAHLRGLRILCPDLPGFGESTPLVGVRHDIAGYVVWLRGFVDALSLGSTVVILGHSFGSIVVSSAVANGLNASRLIFVNPIAGPALEGPNAIMSRLTLLYYRTCRALPERLGRRLLSSWLMVRTMSVFLVQTKDKALRRWIHDQHHTYYSRYANCDTVIEGFEASIGSDMSMFAAKITPPSILIGADRDPITSVKSLHALKRLFPHARLEILTHVGHLVHYEKPRATAELIVDFLGEGRVADL